MSVGQKIAIDVKQLTSDSGGIGNIINTLDLEGMTIQLAALGGATGTVQFEGTLDGANWFALGAAVTTSGAFNVALNRVAAIRARTTVNVAGGSYVAALAGGARGE